MIIILKQELRKKIQEVHESYNKTGLKQNFIKRVAEARNKEETS